MKTEEILNLDYRKEENQEIIQKVLRKIKPLSKYSDEENIPIEAIERTIRVLTNKYEIQPQWITCSHRGEILSTYSCGIKTSNTHELLGNVYGMCVYELIAKMAIKMYSDIRTKDIPIRALTKEEAERERKAKKIDKEVVNE